MLCSRAGRVSTFAAGLAAAELTAGGLTAIRVFEPAGLVMTLALLCLVTVGVFVNISRGRVQIDLRLWGSERAAAFLRSGRAELCAGIDVGDVARAASSAGIADNLPNCPCGQSVGHVACVPLGGESADGELNANAPNGGCKMTTLNVSMLLLWIVVFVLLGFVLALARQVGVLYERIAPIGALTIEAGLKVGDEAPLFDLDDIDGRPIAIGRPSLRSTLLFFMSPDCPVCKKLIPIVLSLHRAEVALLDVVFASDGSIDEHKAFLKRVSVGTTPLCALDQTGSRVSGGEVTVCGAHR